MNINIPNVNTYETNLLTNKLLEVNFFALAPQGGTPKWNFVNQNGRLANFPAASSFVIKSAGGIPTPTPIPVPVPTPTPTPTPVPTPVPTPTPTPTPTTNSPTLLFFYGINGLAVDNFTNKKLSGKTLEQAVNVWIASQTLKTLDFQQSFFLSGPDVLSVVGILYTK